ncbi:MAG: glycosyltransferase, partial [Anaerolineae bacterium]|nr:glycosyltransferase [Anaerolineae bacterium]
MIDRLRIAHVTATFPPYRGGTGNVCYHNARELARRGHDVHVFTSTVDGAPQRETRDGIEIHRLSPLVRVGNAPLLPQL